MNARIYHALVTTPQATLQYELHFERPPCVREVLSRLHERVKSRQESAIELTVNIMRQAHVTGQEEQEFNESVVFLHTLGDSWLRIYCPQLLCPTQDSPLL
jgi:hypothetical protein